MGIVGKFMETGSRAYKDAAGPGQERWPKTLGEQQGLGEQVRRAGCARGFGEDREQKHKLSLKRPRWFPKRPKWLPKGDNGFHRSK